MSQRIIPARSKEAKLAAACREAFSILSAVQPLCAPLKPITSAQAGFIEVAAAKVATLLHDARYAYHYPPEEDLEKPPPLTGAPLPFPEEGAERAQGRSIRAIVDGIGRPVDPEA